MPKTFEEAQEEEAEERGEVGEIFQESPLKFEGLGLIERFEQVESFLRSFPRDRPDIPEPPGAPGTGDGLPDIDIDLEEVSQKQLLALLIQVQLSQTQRLNQILQYVSPPTTITVSGIEVLDDADEAHQIIPQSVPTRRIYIRADPQNTAHIWIGDDQVEPQSGFQLRKGEWMSPEIDYRNVPLYATSEEDDQLVQLLGVA